MHFSRRRSVTLLALACSAALIISIAAPFSRKAPLQAATNTTAKTTRAKTARTAPLDKVTDAVVTKAIEFVEAKRGLRFKRRPAITVLGGDAFVQRFDCERSSDPDYASDLAEMSGLLRSFGFVTSDGDPEKLIDAVMAGGVSGFYVPKTKELVIRAGAITPGARITIVHELVHALEDQHFGLDRPELDKATDDSSAAFQFLAEGSARHIENLYRASLSKADTAAANTEEMQMTTQGDLLRLALSPAYAGAFPFLLSILLAPYEQGKLFVAAVIKAGGTAALDSVYADPPVTTEQATDLVAYRAREAAITVPVPPVPSGAKVLGAGVLGESGLNALVSTPASMIDSSKIGESAQGWGGDSYVIWSHRGSVCTRVDLVMDTTKDLTELRRALARLARSSNDAGADATVADQGKGLRYTTCAKS